MSKKDKLRKIKKDMKKKQTEQENSYLLPIAMKTLMNSQTQ